MVAHGDVLVCPQPTGSCEFTTQSELFVNVAAGIKYTDVYSCYNRPLNVLTRCHMQWTSGIDR